MDKEEDRQRRTRSSFRLTIFFLVLLGGGVYLFRHHLPLPAFFVAKAKPEAVKAEKNGKDGKKSAPSVTSVVALPVRTEDFRVYLDGLGTAVPHNTVTVKTRVDGQLMSVYFREGQIVKQGDLLAAIDPRPFEVQLTQAQGQMARDQSLLKNAQLDLERYRTLADQGFIPKQQLTNQEALVHQYKGMAKADQGLIDSAKLQLLYSRITAPVGGRVGLRLVDPGNIVRATDPDGLVVITEIQPIAVIFALPQDNLPRVLDKLKVGRQLPVEAYDREDKQKLASGTLLTVDNRIDTGTGTVRLKALFPNTDNELFPNQFVNARLLVDIKLGAAVIPAASIQRGAKGAFVYVVKTDKTVEVRQITLGETRADAAVVIEGLSPDELVVVEGTEKLREGAKVDVKTKTDVKTKQDGPPKKRTP